MSRQPSISIVVTNHNYGCYLRQCIDSCLAQTLPAEEIVVVDDGSRDESRGILASYGSRIRTVFQENRGQAAALQAGLALVRGDWVHTLDADDWLDPDCLRRFSGKMDEGIVWVYCRQREMDVRGWSSGLRPPACYPLIQGDVLTQVRQGAPRRFPQHSANCFHRLVFSGARLHPDSRISLERISPDSFLQHLAITRGRVAAVDEPLSFYRLHGTNHSRSVMRRVEGLHQRMRGEIEVLGMVRDAAPSRCGDWCAESLLLGEADASRRLLLLVRFDADFERIMMRNVGELRAAAFRALWRDRRHRNVANLAWNAARLMVVGWAPRTWAEWACFQGSWTSVWTCLRAALQKWS